MDNETVEEVQEDGKRKIIASEWRDFRERNLFTQAKLAEVLGTCRRTVQLIEGAKVTPHKSTLRQFEVLKAKYAANQRV